MINIAIYLLRMKNLITLVFLFLFSICQAQDPDTMVRQKDTLPDFHPDSSLRVINLNPFFTLHVDSTLHYQLQINKNPSNYFWYLRNSPVGLRINKDNGLLTFKAD